MIYKSTEALKIEDIKSLIESNEKSKIIDGLLSLFMNDIDKDMAIDRANWAMQFDDTDIKKIGIIGMGHIARVYGLDNTKVFEKNIQEIEKSKDKSLIGILDDAKDDFEVFIQG
jgi:signal-transduction protein with cAMP-binding, CBS, and nucleotidyltransferase domain